MRLTLTTIPLVALLAAGGCAGPAIMGNPAVTVVSVGETTPVGTANEDAADDPAIWRNPDDPSASLIVATDKKAGLYVYGLDGKVRDFVPGGLLNNVDLEDLGAQGIIVAASDRGDISNSHVALYRLDPRAAKLEAIGSISSGPGEAYGLCMGFGGSGQSVFAVMKDGRIREYELENISGPSPSPTGRLLREMSVPSQAEGCVVDPRNGDFYVGEEAGGIWRFAKDAAQGELVTPVDNAMLVADVEGLAIAPMDTEGGYLVASSQGDNAYAVFSLPGMEPVGRFRIASGAFGATEETDGIALNHRSFGPAFPQGLFVAQDGQNAPHAQNFKLVRWDEVLAALKAGTSGQNR